jgi:3-hydroxyisobutyrate dehydrogenase-like beta-hydroxyacid dehydrogenase
MSDITVIGLGLMGSALARAIQHAGHDLTVWNRSPQKMQAFIDDGVDAAADIVAAITVSPVILFNIDNYAVSNAILQSAEIAPLLQDRTIVQLSTGTPNEADEIATWMAAQEAYYLDGAVLAGPEDIGTDTSLILLSGNDEAYSRAGNLLECLGGKVRYLGSNVRAASALDLAWLCDSYGRFLAVTHAARICESEGVDMDEFARLFPRDPTVQSYATVISTDGYENCTATLKVWRAALQRILEQGRDAGISTGFPDHVDQLMQRAEAAGYGEQHVMAMVKVLREDQ